MDTTSTLSYILLCRLNMDDLSEEQRECFHQDICTVVERYQGYLNTTMMAEYCWGIQSIIRQMGCKRRFSRTFKSDELYTIKDFSLKANWFFVKCLSLLTLISRVAIAKRISNLKSFILVSIENIAENVSLKPGKMAIFISFWPFKKELTCSNCVAFYLWRAGCPIDTFIDRKKIITWR